MLSLKLQEEIFIETEKIVKKLNIPRNKYINEALTFYNAKQKRALIEKQLAYESKILQENPDPIGKEWEEAAVFDGLEDEYDYT